MKKQINYYVETSQYLLTKTSFFISSSGKIESVQEFKMEFFEQLFHCRRQSCKICMSTCRSFSANMIFHISEIMSSY